MAAAVPALVLLGLACGEVRAGERYPHYTQVPRTFAQLPQVWAGLLEAAETGTVRLCVLGDSQETCPGGKGVSYIPNLNYRFWLRYGNCPETPLIYQLSTGGHSLTNAAGWLWRGGSAANSGGPGRVDTYLLPPQLHLYARAMTDKPPQDYGWLYMLYHDARNVGDPSLAMLHEYFRRDGEIRAQFVAATNESSGEIEWRALPTDGNPANGWGPSFFVPATGQGTVTPGLEQPGEIEFKVGLTDALDYGGKTYMVVEGWGSDAETLTDFMGVRYRNLSHPRGVVVQDFSAGGMRVRRLIDDHGGMGACLVALEYDAFIVHMGANDAFSAGITAEAFHDDLLELIDLLRAAHENPQLPIVIAIDVHRADAAPVLQAQFDQQAGAAWEIAQADPYVMLLNLRRITEEDLGWGPDDESFLEDLVHLTIVGQAQLAAAAVPAFFEAAGDPDICPDLTADGVVDVEDLVTLILAFGQAQVPADLDQDGAVDVPDLVRLILSWGPC